MSRSDNSIEIRRCGTINLSALRIGVGSLDRKSSNPGCIGAVLCAACASPGRVPKIQGTARNVGCGIDRGAIN